MSHSTVAHRWFHQIGNKSTGENSFTSGNMFYEKQIIYSYGYHFALGIRFEDTVILNSKSYSNSTSKHQGHTRGAVDRDTHRILNLPLIEARNFPPTVKFKEVYKLIDFKTYVDGFEHNLKKLRNARKPQLYLKEMEYIQNELKGIFRTFRGSKTFALKNNKDLKNVLKFEFTEDVKQDLKKAYEAEKKKKAKELKALKAKNMQKVYDYEAGEIDSLPWGISNYTGIDTAIRVKAGVIETSKGMKIDLADGVRVFKLWQAGKAIGVEIKTKGGDVWKCSKANGVIKFGCHIIDFDQAKRVLTPYL